MNNPESFRGCVTVTPWGIRIFDLRTSIFDWDESPLTFLGRKLQIAIRNSSEGGSNSGEQRHRGSADIRELDARILVVTFCTTRRQDLR